MSKQRKLSVHLGKSGSDARRQRAVLATLPGSFRITDDHECDVLFVSGRDGSVSDLLGNLSKSTKSIVVAGVSMLHGDERKLIEDASAKGVIIIPALEFIPRLLSEDNSLAQECFQLVDHVCYLSDDEGRVEALAEQLLSLDQFVSSQIQFEHPNGNSRSLILAGRTVEQGAEIRLALVHSPLKQARWSVNLISRLKRISFEADATASAKPAVVRHFDKHGERNGINVYQNSHRLTWKKLHEAMREDSSGGSDTYNDLIAKIEQAYELLNETESFRAVHWRS